MTTSARMLSCHYSSWRCPAGNTERLLIPRKKLQKGVPGLRVTYVSLEGCNVTELFFYQHLTGVSWTARLTPQGADKICQGYTPRLVEPSVTSGPCSNSYRVSRPFLSIQAFFQVKQSHDHLEIFISLYGEKRYKMELFTLLCLDYKQIFTCAGPPADEELSQLFETDISYFS